MNVICRNCNVALSQHGKINFSGKWYNHFKCPTCNTSEYRAVNSNPLL